MCVCVCVCVCDWTAVNIRAAKDPLIKFTVVNFLMFIYDFQQNFSQATGMSEFSDLLKKSKLTRVPSAGEKPWKEHSLGFCDLSSINHSEWNKSSIFSEKPLKESSCIIE